MNRTADRHRAARSTLVAVLGAIAVVFAGTVPYAMAQDNGQDHHPERRAVPDRPPARGHAPVTHQRGPENVNRAPQVHERGPVIVNRAPQVHERGPVIVNRAPQVHERGPVIVDRAPQVHERGPENVNRAPQVHERGPVIVNRAPQVHERGPVIVNRAPQVHERGPVIVNRAPQVHERGPVIVNRAPRLHERGPLVVGRRVPERIENHGPPGFRDRPRDRDHDYFDDRYNHGRYYPRRGAVVRVLPSGYRPFYYHRRPYFFVGGVWYLNGPGGYIVTAPPLGLTVSILPPFYTTLWLGGQQYYYADDVYYSWNPGLNAYVVVTPPTADVAETATPPPPQEQNPDDQLYIYPAKGQDEQQQAQDRFDCYSWAKGQTGFDPTQPGGGVPADENTDKHEQYRRAMTACLTARGYSVN